jgi:hypothetical protein
MVRERTKRTSVKSRPADDVVRTFDVGEQMLHVIEFIENGQIVISGMAIAQKNQPLTRQDLTQRILSDLQECQRQGELHFWRRTFDSWKNLELQVKSARPRNKTCSSAARAAQEWLGSFHRETDFYIREKRPLPR